MFSNLKNILIGVFAAIIVVAVGASAYTAFASANTGATTSAMNTTNYGYGNGNGNSGNAGTTNVTGTPLANGTGNAYGNGTGTSVLDIPASDLSADETAGLLFMREEEKLARDVYNALFTVWGQPTFQNIAASEQAHMDEIKLLLDRYGLADPAQDPGIFTDQNLQALYDQLVAQGSASLADAVKVGGAIEEIDILDLQTRLAQTDNADIQQVYNNLMSGSENHLRSFAGVLQTTTGETYVPQYMSVNAYQAIMSGSNSNGYQGGRNGNGNSAAVPSTDTTGSGIPNPQADISGASTISGTVSAYDLVSLTVFTSDGQTVTVQLGSSQYASSIGFNPTIGAPVTVTGFPGDQGLFSAISVTVNGQTYSFRDASGRPLWAGGQGQGNGGQGGGGNH